MSVAIEGTPTQTSAFNTLTGVALSWTHTTGASATGLVVWVGSSYQRSAVTGVTFNGDAMTEICNVSETSLNWYRITGFVRASPYIGAGTVEVTMGGAAETLWAAAVSVSGGNSYRSPAVAGGATGLSTPSLTVSASQSDDLVIAGLVAYGTPGTSANTGVLSGQPGGGSFYVRVTSQVASGASTVMSWDTATHWSIGAVSLYSGVTTFSLSTSLIEPHGGGGIIA